MKSPIKILQNGEEKSVSINIPLFDLKQRGAPYFSSFEEICIVISLLKFSNVVKNRVFKFGESISVYLIQNKGVPLIFLHLRKFI